MEVQRVEIDYRPRDQFVAYHERTERFAKIVAHRRFGKTVGCINDKIRAALSNRREYPPPRYGYVAPTYTQAKDIAWGYLKHYSAPIPGLQISESELWIEYPNKARVRLYGADNYDRMRGLYFDGLTVDEPAQMDPRAWPEVMRPTLSDYNGWATFIGTPRGRDWFFKIDRDEKDALLPDFFRLTLKASQSGIIAPAELASIRAMLSEDQYNQEFECSFDAAVVGSYYGRLMREAEEAKRICSVPHDPAALVEVWMDLGIGDPTAMWFVQRVGRELHAIDYYENAGEGVAHYANVVNEKSRKYGYNYDMFVVPHDAEAREKGSGKSYTEFMDTLGMKPYTVNSRESAQVRIEAARMLIPRFWFDRDKCARGIECLKHYRQEWDDDHQSFKNRPLHDWTSHGADGFGEGCRYQGTKTSFGRIEYPKNHISRGVI